MDRLVARRRGFRRHEKPKNSNSFISWMRELWSAFVASLCEPTHRAFQLTRTFLETQAKAIISPLRLLFQTLKSHSKDFIIICATFYMLMFSLITHRLLFDLLAQDLNNCCFLSFMISMWVWMIYRTKLCYDNFETNPSHVGLFVYIIITCVQHLLLVTLIVFKSMFGGIKST